MRKLIVTEFVTLDGVMEAPGGDPTHPHSGWVFDFIGDEQLEFKLQEVLEADAHLIGRVTYESFAGAWPERTGEFAEEVTKLKQQDGGPILVAGSRTLVHTLMGHDLIDEYRLMVFPFVLGSGKRLFPESPDKTTLELVDTKTFDTGVQVHTYRPAGHEPQAA